MIFDKIKQGVVGSINHNAMTLQRSITDIHLMD